MKNAIFKWGYKFGIQKIFQKYVSGKLIIVLCLHRINPVKDSFFQPIHPLIFQSLIRYLKKDYVIISLDEAAHYIPPKSSGKVPVVITFDDGYRDFLDYALPVISKEGIVVNHNIVTNCANTGQLIWTQRLNNILRHLVGRNELYVIESEGEAFKSDELKPLQLKRLLFRNLFSRPYSYINEFCSFLENKYSFDQPGGEMMDWKDIRTCQQAGVEIGSHTTYHSSLQQTGDMDFLKTEIIESKECLEKNLNTVISSFAFPNGLAHPVAYKMAIEAGYTNMLLVEGVHYPFNTTPNKLVHAFDRVLLGHSTVHENLFNIAGFHKSFHGRSK